MARAGVVGPRRKSEGLAQAHHGPDTGQDGSAGQAHPGRGGPRRPSSAAPGGKQAGQEPEEGSDEEPAQEELPPEHGHLLREGLGRAHSRQCRRVPVRPLEDDAGEEEAPHDHEGPDAEAAATPADQGEDGQPAHDEEEEPAPRQEPDHSPGLPAPLLPAPLLGDVDGPLHVHDPRAGQLDADPCLARFHGGALVGEDEAPVHALGPPLGLGRDLPEAVRTEAEAVPDPLQGQGAGFFLAQRLPRRALRDDVVEADDPATPVQADPPLLGPLLHASPEAGVADLPPRLPEVAPQEAPVALLSQLPVDEAVGPVPLGARAGQGPPGRVQGHTPGGEGVPDQGPGLAPGELQGRGAPGRALRHPPEPQPQDRRGRHQARADPGGRRRAPVLRCGVAASCSGPRDRLVALPVRRRGPSALSLVHIAGDRAPVQRFLGHVLPDTPADPGGDHDGQGREPRRHDHRAVEPDSRGAGDPEGKGHPDQVVGEVAEDGRDEAVAEVDDPEGEGRQQELNQTGVGRLLRVVGVGPGEDHCLEHQRRADPERPSSGPGADQSRAGQGHRAEEGLLEGAGEERRGHRREPGKGGGDQVGLDQGLGRRPPAENPGGEEVEGDGVGDEEGGEEVAAQRASEEVPAVARPRRPGAPEPGMVPEGLPGQALADPEDQGQQEPAPDEDGPGHAELLQPEASGRHRRVVRHPGQGQPVELGPEEEHRHDGGRGQGGAPGGPPLPEEDEEPDPASDQDVEEARPQGREEGDEVVGRPHLPVPTLEGLRHQDGAAHLGEAIARHLEAEAEAGLAHRLAPLLVDEGVVGPSSREGLLGGLDQAVRREIHVPAGGGRGLRDAPGLGFGEARPRLVLGQPKSEAVHRPVRSEANPRFPGPAGPEEPDRPEVGAVLAPGDDPVPDVPAAALELDVRLRHGILEPEGGGGPGVVGCQLRLPGPAPGPLQDLAPGDLQVQGDHGEGRVEVDGGSAQGPGRDDRGDDPAPEVSPHGGAGCGSRGCWKISAAGRPGKRTRVRIRSGPCYHSPTMDATTATTRMTKAEKEVRRRRTFAIISHPDAGKTTLTEKLLLYGGALHLAGSVKARRARRHVTSDWMEMEKERGISVTSSVLQFDYEGYRINLLDTPGHQDFSEDTYRTLIAADSAVMLLDNRKGVEAQTRKLFNVCKRRRTPIFTFVNKCDRVGEDPLQLLGDVENELGIHCVPITWPVFDGPDLLGVCDRRTGEVLLFEKGEDHGQTRAATRSVGLESEELQELLGDRDHDTLREEMELLEVAGTDFDEEAFLAGELAPTFFGSALTNFGVEPFLRFFLREAPPPVPRQARDGETEIEPLDEDFTGLVFKIQANMDPKHRDRVAFVRICSGRFEPGMEVRNVRSGKEVRLASPKQFFGQERKNVEEAWPGDVVGIHDRGSLRIGDTLSAERDFEFEEIPRFPPEHFAHINVPDPLRRKHLDTGLRQLSEEGAAQVFYEESHVGPRPIVGAVGALQFDVLLHRLESEYGVEAELTRLPYSKARWVTGPKEAIDRLGGGYDRSLVYDSKDRPLILFKNDYALRSTVEREDDVEFHQIAP